MSKKRFYFEVSFVILYTLIVLVILAVLWSHYSQALVGAAMIGCLAIISSLLHMISNFYEYIGQNGGLKDEHDG